MDSRCDSCSKKYFTSHPIERKTGKTDAGRSIGEAQPHLAVAGGLEHQAMQKIRWPGGRSRPVARSERRGEWVFANPLTANRITDPHRQVVNVVAKSGVPFSPHDLRRTFASIVSRLGDRLSYYTTKRQLNHRTSDVTQGYVQFDLEQLRSAMQAVEDFVLQKVGETPSDATRTPDANDKFPSTDVSSVASPAPHVVAVRADQRSNLGPAD